MGEEEGDENLPSEILAKNRLQKDLGRTWGSGGKMHQEHLT